MSDQRCKSVVTGRVCNCRRKGIEREEYYDRTTSPSISGLMIGC